MDAPYDRNHPDRPRIPPGQYVTEDFPIIHAGSVHHVDPTDWKLEITGLISEPETVTWSELHDYPPTEQTVDIHCVTRWSKLDTRWKGVRAVDLLRDTEIATPAAHVLVHAVDEWTTNLPLAELLQPDVLLAYEYEGEPIPDEHGGPVRLVVPRLYFWKSAKWPSEIEFVETMRIGYWESMGYHPLGDPWKEERYADVRSL